MAACDGFEEVGLGAGWHNENLERERLRLYKAQSARDCSTIVLTLTRGTVAIDVATAWLRLIPMMNQKFGRLFVSGASVMEGYNNGVQKVLEDKTNWKYILFLEDDVIPPPDIWPRLVESIELGQYDGVSGLCWTRTHQGHPMILGEPGSGNYYPQVPLNGGVQPCEAIPLGATLMRADLFRKLGKPWFRDDCGLEGDAGGRTTVDIYLCHHARKLGATFAVDTSVQVAHMDANSGEKF